MSVQPCKCGNGQCAVPDAALAMEHGRVFLTTPQELAERWQVDLASVRPRVRVDAGIEALLDAHTQASSGGSAVQVAPLPKELTRFARLVVVECGPCGHRFMADV